MRNSFGNRITVTLFGESHGEYIGAVLDGLPAGLNIDLDFIKDRLNLRKGEKEFSTARNENDDFKIISGAYNNFTTGSPLCIVIKNQDARPSDYGDCLTSLRPSHSDYTAHIKYGGFEDFHGGGHLSGRLTAPIVAVAAILIPALKAKGIEIGSHILRCGDICDREFENVKEDISALYSMPFAVLDSTVKSKMQEKILELKKEGDSIGGAVETAVIGLPCGIGEPYFDSTESMLSHAVFSIPAVKGIEFGLGFDFAKTTGSKANDAFCICDNRIITSTNNSGGINGGISNGMPIIFKTAIRPTPTISKEQNTVNIKTGENVKVAFSGRHDPFIAHKAVSVINAVTAITLADLLSENYGTDWLVK